MKLSNEDLQLIKRQRSILGDDLEDQLREKRRKDDVGPDQDFLERAHANAIVPRAIALYKQKKAKFNRSAYGTSSNFTRPLKSKIMTVKRKSLRHIAPPTLIKDPK
ncbi:hypothetical protein DTO271G3_8242 [Paecilomyces variotii]|nr:hypothetical protein DTO271G3_8242 [Paecilomyces variotii]